MASIATDRGGEKNSRRPWPVYVSSFFPYFSSVVRFGIAKKAMKLTFSGDKSQSVMGHLHTIEDICSLFKHY
jgi:hypothetical protein